MPVQEKKLTFAPVSAAKRHGERPVFPRFRKEHKAACWECCHIYFLFRMSEIQPGVSASGFLLQQNYNTTQYQAQPNRKTASRKSEKPKQIVTYKTKQNASIPASQAGSREFESRIPLRWFSRVCSILPQTLYLCVSTGLQQGLIFVPKTGVRSSVDHGADRPGYTPPTGWMPAN